MNYWPLFLVLAACHSPIVEEIEEDIEHGLDVHLAFEEDEINGHQRQ